MEVRQQAVDLENEGSLMLRIFPVEIWDKVLKNFEQDIPTYKVFIRSSTFFESLLTTQKLKTKLLFPQVLPILVDQLSSVDTSELYRNFCLTLRLVCRDWKDGVDSYLEPFMQQFVLKKELLDSHPAQKLKSPWNWFPRLNFMRDMPVVQNYFERTQHGSGANTFVTGTFSLRFDDIWFYGAEATKALRDLQLNLCLEFFSKYGTLFRYIRIFLPSYDRIWCNWLNHVLQHLPNLKGMSIELNFGKPVQPAIQHPTLVFKNLQFLRFRNAYSLQSYLVQKNPQLAKLEITIDDSFNIFDCQLESLTSLKIKNDSNKRVQPHIINLQFQSLKASPFVWRIVELELQCGDQEISFILLCKALQIKLGETLKHLQLKFGTKQCIDRSARLSLPNLETLSIHVFKYFTIDFILPMRDNLQQLFVRTEEEHKKFFDTLNLIRLYSLRNELYISKVWEMFKNMKKIEYETKAIQKLTSNVCTREDWRTYKRREENNSLVTTKRFGCIVC